MDESPGRLVFVQPLSALRWLRRKDGLPRRLRRLAMTRGVGRSLGGLMLLFCLAGCHHDLSPQDVNVRGLVPALALSMTDVASGKAVTEAHFRGQVVLLYFGYTNCPDVCPATLYNVDKILRGLGPLASHVRLLFVTVDPDRDSPAALAQYVGLFGPNMVGLRGTPDELFSLARRYRVVFSVTKTPVYAVSHSAAIYVFNARGQARFLIAGLDTTMPDFKGIEADLADVARE